MQGALVDLVDDHVGDSLERLVRMQPAQQNACRAEEQPRRCGALGLETYLVADALAERLASLGCHPRGDAYG